MRSFKGNGSLGALSIKSLVAVCFLFSGCYSVRPLTVADPVLMAKIEASPKPIVLVMDETYRNYVKTDSGNIITLPQKYFVGEALTPLSIKYFKKAFENVQIATILPSAGLRNAIVLKVISFDNRLFSLGVADKQKIDIDLSADIYDFNLNRIKTVQAHGQAEGWITTGESTSDSQKVTSSALQTALADLVKNCQAFLEAILEKVPGPKDQKKESMEAALQAYARTDKTEQ